MPTQNTIVDVALVLITLAALALIALAWAWRRWRARRVRPASLPFALRPGLPLTVEQEQWVRQRIAELEAQQASAAPAPAAVNWPAALLGAFHVLILGQQRSGKTVIAHLVATARAQQGHRVLVADPDARPGMWPGCEVAGGGDDWPAIEALLAVAQAEIEARRRQRARLGRRSFAPLTLVLSDAADIMNECPSARAVFEAALRRGGKLGIHLVVDVQDKQVGTLNIPGASHLLKNFDEEIAVRRAGEQRIVTYRGADYPVPTLLDPEALADEHARQHPPTADAERLLSSLFDEIEAVPVRPDHAANSASAARTGTPVAAGTAHQDAVPPEGGAEADAQGVPALLTDEAIRTLYSAWGSKNKIAAMLRGTKARRLEQVDAALAAQAEERAA